jgi:hypothetical protein
MAIKNYRRQKTVEIISELLLKNTDIEVAKLLSFILRKRNMKSDYPANRKQDPFYMTDEDFLNGAENTLIELAVDKEEVL